MRRYRCDGGKKKEARELDPEEAKQWLDKAREWIAQARQSKPGGSAWDRLPWAERRALKLLQTEAEKLLAEGRPMPDKSGC
jgi:hypothetical protein